MLMAGSAKKCITPSPGLFTKVVTESERYSYTGIADDDTYMRAIVLVDGKNKALIMGSELSVFPLPKVFAKMAQERFGIPCDNCVLTGTRGHNVFTVGAQSFEELEPAMAEYASFIHQISMEVIEEAFSKLEKARIGAAVGQSAINACRDYVTPVGTLEASNRLYGNKAYQLPVMRLESMDGKTIGLFVSYAMQATYLSWNQFNNTFNKYSGDIAGVIMSFLEKQGASACIWCCGGGDDQRGLGNALLEYCGIEENGKYKLVREALPPEATWMHVRADASEHAMDILRTIETISEYKDALTIKTKDASKMVRRRKQYRKGLGDGKRPDSVLIPVDDSEPLEFHYRLCVLNDDIAFLGINADTYSSYYQKAISLLKYNKLFLMDAYYGNISSLPDAANEENEIYGCGSWGSKCYSATEAEKAFINAMEELKC